MDTATARDLILEEVEDERLNQDLKWGGIEHDMGHSFFDWVALITKHAGKALCEDGQPQRMRRQFLRVAALAVAAVESYDARAARAGLPTATVTINGKQHHITKPRLHWAEIIDLAYDGHPTSRDFHSSVVYSGGPPPKNEGILIAGQSVEVCDGLHIDAVVTDNA